MTILTDIQNKIRSKTTTEKNGELSIFEVEQKSNHESLITREGIFNTAAFITIVMIVLIPSWYFYKSSLWEDCVGSSYTSIRCENRTQIIQKCSETLSIR